MDQRKSIQRHLEEYRAEKKETRVDVDKVVSERRKKTRREK